jgi:hypothetical protein
MVFELVTGDFLFDPRADQRGNYSRDDDHLAQARRDLACACVGVMQSDGLRCVCAWWWGSDGRRAVGLG